MCKGIKGQNRGNFFVNFYPNNDVSGVNIEFEV